MSATSRHGQRAAASFRAELFVEELRWNIAIDTFGTLVRWMGCSADRFFEEPAT